MMRRINTYLRLSVLVMFVLIGLAGAGWSQAPGSIETIAGPLRTLDLSLVYPHDTGHPVGIAVDDSGDVYVANRASHRVERVIRSYITEVFSSADDSQLTDSLRTLYHDDAARLAVRKINEEDGPLNEEVELPSAHVDTLYHALIRVHNAAGIAGHTSVIERYRIHIFPILPLRRIYVGIDSSLQGIDAWRNGQRLTGNSSIDTLMIAFDLELEKYYLKPKVEYVILRASRPLNLIALTRRFSRIEGIRFAELVWGGGDGDNITAQVDEDAVQLDYSHGWGDCPAGCISRQYWTYRIYPDDRVRFIGTRKDPEGFVGIVQTIAGIGEPGSSPDGVPATQANLHTPGDVYVDHDDTLYIADSGNHRIRKVSPDGIITTIAGTGARGFSGDGGVATLADLDNPEGIVVDTEGNLYISDTGNHRIRKVDRTGDISTVAGNGTPGFTGDNGSATQASLNRPIGIAIDDTGNLYMADRENGRIRKVDSAGVISTVAGNGVAGYGGDGGPATLAALNFPIDVTVDGTGNLYIADTHNHRIRKVNPSGFITTIAGTGLPDDYSSDDEPATLTGLYFPTNLTINESGMLYFFDSSRRVRAVFGAGPQFHIIPHDTGTVIMESFDKTHLTVSFTAGKVTDHTLAIELSRDPPHFLSPTPLPFETYIFSFSITTSLPDTTVFKARVTATYADSQLETARIANEQSLTFAVYDPALSTWTFVPTVLDTAANTATMTTSRFSAWALVSTEPAGIEAVPSEHGLPTVFMLSQNYPNPFNPTTTIRFELPEPNLVTLRIYNILGQEVARLIDSMALAPGAYTVRWDGRNRNGESAASGVYIYRLEAGAFVASQKMTLLR